MLQLTSPQLLFNKQKVFLFTGNTKKKSTNNSATGIKIVLLYEYPAAELPQPLKEMMDKLVQACKYKPEEAVYVNVNFSEASSFSSLQARFQPGAILIFGPVTLSRNMPGFKKHWPYEMSGVKILSTEDIAILEKNQAVKTAFWGCLKKMLGV